MRTWTNLGTDEHDAKVQALRIELAVAEGRRVKRAAGSGFSELADDWLASKEADPDARPNSISVYKTRVGYAKKFLGECPIAEIKQDDINRLVAAFTKEIGAATASNVLSVVSAVLTQAAQRGITVPNLMFRGMVPARRSPQQSHTVTELRGVVGLLAEPFSSMCEFALLTGMRRGEILALSVEDVEGQAVRVRGNLNLAGEIGPTKTASGTRVVTLSKRGAEIVETRVKAVRSGRLWPVSLRAADQALRDGMKAAGVYRQGHCWHALRHAHTALLNESGVSLRDSAARLGHGANYAQSLAYGWASEQVDVSGLDAAVSKHGDRGESQ